MKANVLKRRIRAYERQLQEMSGALKRGPPSWLSQEAAEAHRKRLTIEIEHFSKLLSAAMTQVPAETREQREISSRPRVDGGSTSKGAPF